MHATTKIATMLAAATALVPTAARAQSECSPSNVMFLLDKSYSMNNPLPGTEASKWEVATDALNSIASAYQDKAQLGLTVFPSEPGVCGPGAELVTPAFGNRDVLVSALGEAPASNSWTPIAEAISGLATSGAVGQPDDYNYVVFITDGWQCCDLVGGECTDPDLYAALDSIDELNAQGVTTYVVGFGEGVHRDLLQQLAVKAGTARPGCDADSDDPDDDCYYQANSPDELIMALANIATEIPTGETCDGLDNDCDGEVDEAEANPACETECGVGVQVCQAGALTECQIPDEDNLCLETGDAGGCGCRSTDGKGGAGGLALVLGVAGMLLWRRRRRS